MGHGFLSQGQVVLPKQKGGKRMNQTKRGKELQESAGGMEGTWNRVRKEELRTGPRAVEHGFEVAEPDPPSRNNIPPAELRQHHGADTPSCASVLRDGLAVTTPGPQPTPPFAGSSHLTPTITPSRIWGLKGPSRGVPTSQGPPEARPGPATGCPCSA